MGKREQPVVTIYPRHKNVNALSNYVVNELFDKYAKFGVGKLITCNREKPKELPVEFVEFHGKIAGANLQELADNSWGLLECEVIIIPRKKIYAKQGRMHNMTAQQIYLGGDIFREMENHYLFQDYETDSDQEVKPRIIRL